MRLVSSWQVPFLRQICSDSTSARLDLPDRPALPAVTGPHLAAPRRRRRRAGAGSRPHRYRGPALRRWSLAAPAHHHHHHDRLLRGGDRHWTQLERAPGLGPPETLAVITGVLVSAIGVSVVLPAAWRTLEPLATLPLALLIWLRRREPSRAVASGGPASRPATRWPGGTAAAPGSD